MSVKRPSLPPRFNGDLETWARQMDQYHRSLDDYLVVADRLLRDSIQEPTDDDKETYTVTNYVATRTYDANATSVEELADVLGTLIKTKQTASQIDGSVT